MTPDAVVALAEAAQERYGFADFKLKGGVLAGLGIELDRDALQAAHELYLSKGLGARDDAIAMQYLIEDWTFDPKRPCLVR
ncbi:hypothetical protein [Kribbella endophytica]